jgi:ERF superfamily
MSDTLENHKDEAMFDCSPTLGALAGALARVQAKLPTIPKSKNATVPMRSGGTYSYAYADLSAVVEIVAPLLAEQELCVVQTPISRRDEHGVLKDYLVSMLLHSSGEWLRGTFGLLIVQPTAQGQGSAITYARRYCYGAMVGVVTDVDEDGQLATEQSSGARGARKAPGTKKAASRRSAAPRENDDGEQAPTGGGGGASDKPSGGPPPSAAQFRYEHRLLNDMGFPNDPDDENQGDSPNYRRVFFLSLCKVKGDPQRVSLLTIGQASKGIDALVELHKEDATFDEDERAVVDANGEIIWQYDEANDHKEPF